MDQDILIKKFQEKDVKAFEKLYGMYSKSILGVIYNIVRDNDIAEEIMQDVFIKVWNNSSSYSPNKGRFFTWILNIARNAAIDQTRSKSFKNSQKNLDAQFFVDILETSENLGDKMNTIGLKGFVNKLAEKCKQVIELLYFKGYTQKEVSEELLIPLGTIKTRNRNCIGELRTMLDI
ncbi:RNA polymerase sigma factor [Urechidicola croceus]|uniref:RNA polymerase subunit sigma-70 n=1 Tax=Urechidicola croceus TaxID=1850246 RepID=A0A1D8P5I2_9FLAO|nr:sigma-70 family RNA polymerase sigma factor [Urechidicola croceus]AOW19826.1 RNA polymerase subunit sigma-70 [Urechidicola croceus]